MFAISWVRFSWELESLPSGKPVVPTPYVVRGAQKDELPKLLKITGSALSIDGAWGDSLRVIGPMMEKSIEAIHAQDSENCLVALHGQRIIGLSAVDPASTEQKELATGPLVLHEYRNRGIGTALLISSLFRLKALGLTKVSGLARERSIAARFIYPKFGGIGDLVPIVPDSRSDLAA